MPYRKPEGPAFDMIADFPKYAEYRKACEGKKIKPVAQRTFSNFRKGRKGYKASKVVATDTPVLYKDLKTGEMTNDLESIGIGSEFVEYKPVRTGKVARHVVYDRKGAR